MSLFNAMACGVDFSPHARHAVRAALRFAARQRTPVTFVHVIDLLLAEAAAVAYDQQRLRSDAEAELVAFVATERTGPAGDVPVDTAIRVGRPEIELVACARERRADLIVLGTHGLGGFRKLFFGSVTEKVLRAAPVPVLAVPLPDREPCGVELGFSSVLAGIDLEAASADVASRAASLAAFFGVPLTLVHVVPALQVAPRWIERRDAAQAARVQEARTELEAVARRLPDADRVRVLVKVGSPADEIPAAAAEMPHALIVIGRGPGGPLHRPGSVAYRVLCQAQTPVLTNP
jgi:nucleotide-binding universal stress UspA family protein